MGELRRASARYGRSMTGGGRRLDISRLAVQIALQGHMGQFYLVSGEVPKPSGSSHPSNLPVGAYLTADGGYLQVHCASQEFAMKALKMMAGEVDELKGMDTDPRFQTQADRMANREGLDDALARGFSSKSREEWLSLLEKWDVPVGPANDIAAALPDPQVPSLNLVGELDHPTARRRAARAGRGPHAPGTDLPQRGTGHRALGPAHYVPPHLAELPRARPRGCDLRRGGCNPDRDGAELSGARRPAPNAKLG